MENQIGIAKIKGKKITIGGNKEVIRAINELSRFGLITFSRQIKFKSTEYTVCFFKPTIDMRNMYNLGNELLVVSCWDGMNDFKSRMKDFIKLSPLSRTF